jgi:[acyl-carrier-protein] S-malonyltransferase
VLAILCPGQGAQSAGFLADWLELPTVHDRLATLGARVGLDLLRLGTDPDADVIDTAIAQPLLVAAGIATAAALGPLPTEAVLVGHSVGELTAAALSGALNEGTAVGFARSRGHAMANAAAVTRSGMTAIVGGDPAEVRAAVADAGCWIANVNGGGQIVAAGTTTNLERLAAVPPTRARLRPLAVAGAFHTPLMHQARQSLAARADTWSAAEPQRTLVSNADGEVVRSAQELIPHLIAQVTAPVRFDQCVERMRSIGVTAAIEVAPAGVLTGIVRRELPHVDVVALRTPADLEPAHELVARFHDVGEQWLPAWTTVVAPAAGKFRRSEQSVTLPDAGTPVRVGAVERRDGIVDVTAAGEVVEWLAHDGDPVTAGQPLARLQLSGPAR